MRQLFSRRKALLGGASLPDFTGYNLTRFYATFKSNIALLNNMGQLTRELTASETNIPFDVSGNPDYSSIIAIDDTVDWFYNYIYCQITGHSIDGNRTLSAADQWCKGWDGATQTNTEKNGKPSFKFKTGNTTATNGMKGTALPELNSGNSFSIVSVVSNEVANVNGAIVNTSLTNLDRFSMFSDRRTNKNNSVLTGSGTSYAALNLLQHDVSTTKIQIVTVNGTTKEMRSYLDGVFQTSVTFAGTYVNDILRFGANLNNLTQLDGHKQMLGIADAVWSDADCLGITNELKTQFGL